MKKKFNRLFLKTTDLVVLEGVAYPTAYKHFHDILANMGKSKDAKITIKEYAEYEDVPLDEVIDALRGR